ELEGGGDLSLQYTPQGDLLLSGRYTLNSGLLKYSLPVFPAKTFTIQSGSYVNWTGNPMDPSLNITALERTRTSVTQDNQSPRMVNFDVVISVKNRLENLALVFNLEAPEDMAIQNQLSAMSAEERGKQAVTMLATGMYLAQTTSGKGGLDMGAALNSFLQNEISSIAGNALKTIDISVGMETVDGNAEDGSGKRTDYSFRFAKRFWNNRMSIIIGGRVSTGDNAQTNNQSFIDNISLEWRLDNSGTRYVKLFHDKNYESILEGEITETGVGVVLRKKMSRLGELFIFRKKKPIKTTLP
ncbi:MAG: translocation/assembly module TamB domain-containing protein, partial [Bacteroidaceae bacterium]